MNLGQLKNIKPYSGKTKTVLRVIILVSALLGIWVLRGDDYRPLRTRIAMGLERSFLVHISFFAATFRVKYSLIRYLLALYLIPASFGVAVIAWHIHGALACAALGLHGWLIIETIFCDTALIHETSNNN